MRAVIILVLVFSFTSVLAGEPLDFEFVDATGSKYRTTTLVENLSSYGWPKDEFEHISVLLLETPSLDDAQYRQQITSLDSLGHDESLQILYVIACHSEEYVHGYHTSVEVARALSGSTVTFRFRLLDRSGIVLHESLKPISTRTLSAWVKRSPN